jgi:hypothetical protein
LIPTRVLKNQERTEKRETRIQLLSLGVEWPVGSKTRVVSALSDESTEREIRSRGTEHRSTLLLLTRFHPLGPSPLPLPSPIPTTATHVQLDNHQRTIPLCSEQLGRRYVPYPLTGILFSSHLYVDPSGCVWDPETGLLHWVDIFKSQIHTSVIPIDSSKVRAQRIVVL